MNSDERQHPSVSQSQQPIARALEYGLCALTKALYYLCGCFVLSAVIVADALAPPDIFPPRWLVLWACVGLGAVVVLLVMRVSDRLAVLVAKPNERARAR